MTGPEMPVYDSTPSSERELLTKRCLASGEVWVRGKCSCLQVAICAVPANAFSSRGA